MRLRMPDRVVLLICAWFLFFFTFICIMAHNAKSESGQHAAWGHAMAYALQTDFNQQFAGHYKMTGTACTWTPYKFAQQEIFVCHTTEHYLKSGKVKRGYLYMLPDGEFLTQDEAQSAAHGALAT